MTLDANQPKHPAALGGSPSPGLQVTQLKHQFRQGQALIDVFEEVSFAVAPGEIVAVAGPSGAGKTTLLLCCGGMLRPTGGSIHLQGQDLFGISAASRASLRAKGIGYLFQTLELIPYLSILDNVRLAAHVDRHLAIEQLAALGLKDRLHHKPDAISHGQRQRAALARALAHRPALLLADEPTGNLDPENSGRVFQTVERFADGGGSVLIASHDQAVQALAHKTVQLRCDDVTIEEPGIA